MNPLLHTLSIVSAATAGGLFSAIWEGAVLAGCVALCLRLLPGLGASARSVIWTNVFVLLVLLHVLPTIPGHGPQANLFHASGLHLELGWSLAIAGGWALLSLWRGIQLIVSGIRLHRMAARATCVNADAALYTRIEDGKRGRAAELCTSTEVERPSVFGFFRPRILLPPALLEQLTPLELQQVVTHELEHLRRGDDWTNLVQKIGLVLFPLNPVLFWVERRLCSERELACDDCVLRSTGARKAYAVCLTRLAEFSILRRSLSLALGAWERQSELVRRVHRILKRPHESMSGVRAAAVTGTLTLGAPAGAVGLGRSPQLVSFAPPAPAKAEISSIPRSAAGGMSARRLGGTPTLVKAVMREKPLEAENVDLRRRVAARKWSVKQPQPLPMRQELIVLTEWDDSEAPQSVVIAVTQVRPSSFAAVAIENGWLIVQI